jgi:hypothetical protein
MFTSMLSNAAIRKRTGAYFRVPGPSIVSTNDDANGHDVTFACLFPLWPLQTDYQIQGVLDAPNALNTHRLRRLRSWEARAMPDISEMLRNVGYGISSSSQSKL